MSESEFNPENEAQDLNPHPQRSAKKLYAFIFLLYFAAMLLLFSSC
jgi:hypothetical protein